MEAGVPKRGTETILGEKESVGLGEKLDIMCILIGVGCACRIKTNVERPHDEEGPGRGCWMKKATLISFINREEGDWRL